MKLTSRLLLYSAVLSIPLLSGIIYGFNEIKWAVIVFCALVLLVEIVYKIQGRTNR